MTGIPQKARDDLAEWAHAADCRLLVLFGSAAAARATATSDVDLALEFDALPEPERRLAIADIYGRRLEEGAEGRP